MKGEDVRHAHDKVTRCLVCGGWMIDTCRNCADRADRTEMLGRSHDVRMADAMRTIETLTAERDLARRLAVALEQEVAELEKAAQAPSVCGCAAVVQALHDKWSTLPAHQLAAAKIMQALGAT